MVLLPFSGTDEMAVAGLIDPELPDFESYWEGCRQGRLRVQFCSACRRHQWPPRHSCVACGHDVTWVEVSGGGELFSWTVIHVSPLEGYRDATPYVVAIAELPQAGGVRVVARLLVDSDTDLRLGLPLAMKFEQVGDHAIPVWLPAADHEG